MVSWIEVVRGEGLVFSSSVNANIKITRAEFEHVQIGMGYCPFYMVLADEVFLCFIRDEADAMNIFSPRSLLRKDG